MNKYELIKKIEDFAPLETQEKWDCSGWGVVVNRGVNGGSTNEIHKVLFALTVTTKVFAQALKLGCDLIISHHPLFYVPLEYKKIDIYCAHTNFDKAIGGTTDLLLSALNFEGKPYNDFVRIVELENEMSVDFLKVKLLQISPRLRVVNNNETKFIKTIGFCAGSGSEFISETPCDAFVTGDVKFHTAVETNKVIFDIGHFESEIFAVKKLKSLTGLNDREGIIADEKSPFI